MDNVTRLLMQGAAGGAAADGEFIDNLFETHLYTGTSGTRSIVNGIDLSTHGGMVWFGARSHTYAYGIQSSNDLTKMLEPNSTQNPYTKTDEVTSFNTNGFTLGASNGSYTNSSNCNYVSHTFRKCPGFFDVVAWTGNNTAGRQIPHNLGSVPGAILVRNIGNTMNWAMYHRGVNGGSNPEQYWMTLNANYAQQQQPHWNNTAPTSTHFTLGNDYEINGPSSQTYVAYLFAHDEAKFGIKGNNSVVKCGNYTGNGSSNGPDVNVGWEPQWILIKRTNSTEDWMKFDNIRTSNRQDMYLDDQRVNINTQDGDGAGSDSQPYLNWTSTGFKLSSNTGHTNGSGDNYIYIAIRRADGYVGKPVTVGTDVFALDYSNGGSFPNFDANFAVDFWLARNPTSGGDVFTPHGRLTGNNYWTLNSNGGWGHSSLVTHDASDGVGTSFGSSYMAWMWKRHAGFDVVTYTGNATSGRTISHSLNNIPEMIVCKKANGTGGWQTYHVGAGNTKYLYWNQNYPAQVSGAVWANTTPTKSVFTIGAGAEVNENGYKFMALLFSSVEGVSKVGSYTGNGTLWHEITTGFQPRFLIIKSATQSYGWFVVDTTRGFASGDEKVLLLNTSGAQSQWGVANPISTGFQLNNDGAINANGEEYLYYAHA